MPFDLDLFHHHHLILIALAWYQLVVLWLLLLTYFSLGYGFWWQILPVA